MCVRIVRQRETIIKILICLIFTYFMDLYQFIRVDRLGNLTKPQYLL